MNKIHIIFFILIFQGLYVQAQELNCNVSINAEKIQTSDRRVFETMQKDIASFINTRKWTDDAFETEERIKCNILITLEKGVVTAGSYEGSIQILALRPVYGATYETVLLNFLDRSFQFEYRESIQMNFNENSFLSNLTSVLGYYINIIVGMDYDSFAPLGGSPYFEKARNILNTAMSSAPGWDEGKDYNGRYWLQENMNHQQIAEFREGFYKYHRVALDSFDENQDEKRKEILEYLKSIRQVNILKPYSIVIKSFFLAKSDELVGVFSKGDMKVREEAARILRELDPLNSEKYQRILMR